MKKAPQPQQLAQRFPAVDRMPQLYQDMGADERVPAQFINPCKCPSLAFAQHMHEKLPTPLLILMPRTPNSLHCVSQETSLHDSVNTLLHAQKLSVHLG